MSALQVSTCAPWVERPDLSCSVPDGVSDEKMDQALQAATDILYVLSGRRFPGVCEDRYRPQSCGCARSRCGCGMPPTLRLARTPVVEITFVKVDGVTLDPSVYRLDNRRDLVRLDGDGWPSGQDATKPTTAVDTFEVSYTWGVGPPPAGVIALEYLAVELAKSVCGQECGLPARVQTITRQNVTMAALDPQTFLDHGRTGIYLVDLFLMAYPQAGGSRRSGGVIVNPDAVASARRS